MRTHLIHRPARDIIPPRGGRLGFVWDPLEADWEEGFSYLKRYKERVGDCRVPTLHKEDGFSLGHWVVTQRKSKELLTQQRRRRLDELSFVWDPLEADWEEGFSFLKLYREREGHCLVPQRRKEENGFRLGQWVNVQRLKKDKLPPERRQRLDELGFVWKAP